jgi:hypothetical protein
MYVLVGEWQRQMTGTWTTTFSDGQPYAKVLIGKAVAGRGA